FLQTIRPVLVENCGGCHNPNSKNLANFLKAATAKAIESDRGLWRSVAVQLRNRTMPPVASKLTEADRLHVSQWVETQLRQTACSRGGSAAGGAVRRLNRREYRNTVRDRLGVDLDVAAIFPADGTGGAGFDTNGDTLYIQPLLMERYLQAAQQILDRTIVTPRVSRSFTGKSATLSIYLDGDYDVHTSAAGAVKVDGADAGALVAQRGGRGGRGAPGFGATVRMDRGTHTIEVTGEAASSGLGVEERRPDASPEKRALHYRLLGS